MIPNQFWFGTKFRNHCPNQPPNQRPNHCPNQKSARPRGNVSDSHNIYIYIYMYIYTFLWCQQRVYWSLFFICAGAWRWWWWWWSLFASFFTKLGFAPFVCGDSFCKYFLASGGCLLSYHVMSCRVMSCRVMSRHGMPCHAMSCHVMSCHIWIILLSVNVCLNLTQGIPTNPER